LGDDVFDPWHEESNDDPDHSESNQDNEERIAQAGDEALADCAGFFQVGDDPAKYRDQVAAGFSRLQQVNVGGREKIRMLPDSAGEGVALAQ